MAEGMKERNVTSLWDDYQNGLAYQGSSGLAKNLPMFVKFYEGKQWPAATEKTKNLPRPVINIVKMICRSKKSAILSSPVKIVFRAEDETVQVDKFNDFASYIQKEIGQEALDKKAVEDGVKKGSYFYHYYWDSEAQGKDGIKEGALRCEVIDPLNIFFANPTELDEQKQEWILIASREDVRSVQAKCDSDVDKDSIAADEADNKYGTVEQKGNNLVTVLTRYFRKDGEVYFEKATRSVIVNKPRPLAPDLDRAGRMLGIEEDAANNTLPDDPEKKSLIPEKTRAPLYPIVVGNYEIRENSIYGLGEIEGIIPNQKAINFNLAMLLLNAQEVAWGKYIVLPNALRGQKINNDPAQVLTDHSGTGNGIKRMQEQSLSAQPLQLIETLTQLTRSATGATEVMNGEVLGKNMSGAAIAQLQAQAKQPIEDLKDAFWLVKEKQGKILIQFFKLFYTQKEYTYEKNAPVFDENGQLSYDLIGRPKTEKVKKKGVFNSSDYVDADISIVVEATSGVKSSAAGDINVLDVLLSNGKISLKTYLDAYPQDALSNKTEILKGIEEDEQSQLAQLTRQLQESQEQLERSLATIEQQQKTVSQVEAVIKENAELRSFIASLYSESKNKLAAANEQIKMGNQKISQTMSDAMRLAEMLKSLVPEAQMGETTNGNL